MTWQRCTQWTWDRILWKTYCGRKKDRAKIGKVCWKTSPPEKIIGGREDGPMTKNRLKNDTFLLSIHEPRSMKDVLENED